MRAIRVASAALLGAGALAFSAPAAVAKDTDITPFGFSVLPSTVARGRTGDPAAGPQRGGCQGLGDRLLGGLRHGHHPAAQESRRRPSSTGTPGPVRCTT